MQRYELIQKGGWDAYGEMEPDDTGYYVLHSEAQARISALEEALREACAEIISLACAGTERIRDLGGECDDAEKTYGPSIAKIQTALGKQP